jgi:hypothetical protein
MGYIFRNNLATYMNSWKDLTAEQYLRISNSKDDKEILRILFGKDLNQIPVKYFEPGALDFLKTVPQTVDVLTYIHEDKVYKLVNLDKISMGEYIDVTSLAEKWETNIWKLMCILYRPVKSLGWKHRLKQFWGKHLMKSTRFFKSTKMQLLATRLYHDISYTVESYDPDRHLLNEDDFKKMPADQFYSFLLFFSLLSMKRTVDILKSSTPPKKKTKETKKSSKPN